MIDLRGKQEKSRRFILEGSRDGETWHAIAIVDESIILAELWHPSGSEYFIWNYTRSRWDPPRRAPR